MGNAESHEEILVVCVLKFGGDEEGEFTKEREEILLREENRKVLFGVERRIRQLTAPRGNSRKSFSSRHMKSPKPGVDLKNFRFSLQDPQDREAIVSACELDPRINKMKPNVVPSFVSEKDFFRNYFTHVAAIRRWALSVLGCFGEDAIIEFDETDNELFRSRGNFTINDSVGAFTTWNQLLHNIQFQDKVDLVKYICDQRPEFPSATVTAARVTLKRKALNQEEAEFRKTKLMDLLKFHQPSVLSILLEESNKTGVQLTMGFWEKLETSILPLSENAETFIDADALECKDERYQNMYASVNKFEFEAKRDLVPVQTAWEFDEHLALAFRELIPGYLTKNAFWNNYFHRVAGIACEIFVLEGQKQKQQQERKQSV